MDDGETTVAARVRPGKSISVFVETGVEVVQTRRGGERRRRVGHRVQATEGDVIQVPARTVQSMPDVLDRVAGDLSDAAPDAAGADTGAAEIGRSKTDAAALVRDYPPDVSAMNVREVERAVAGVDDASVLKEMLDVEQASANRSTAVRAIEHRMEAVGA